MVSWAQWLLVMWMPMITRMLASLGIGVVAFVGVSAAVTVALGAAKSSLSGMAPDVAAIISIGGGFTAMSAMAGGMIGGLAFWSFKRFRILGT